MKKTAKFLVPILALALCICSMTFSVLADGIEMNEKKDVIKVKEGTTYWETAYQTGRSGMVYPTNLYLAQNRVVIVNGWALFNSEGKIVAKVYIKDTTESINLPTIEGVPDGGHIMFHIKGYVDLGWVDESSLYNQEPNVLSNTESILT